MHTYDSEAIKQFSTKFKSVKCVIGNVSQTPIPNLAIASLRCSYGVNTGVSYSNLRMTY